MDQSEQQPQEEEMNKIPEKSKEQIMAERQAKKTAKQQVKGKDSGKDNTTATSAKPVTVKSEVKPKDAKPAAAKAAPAAKAAKVAPTVQAEKVVQVAKVPAQEPKALQESEKNRDQVHAERETRKLAKLAAKKKAETPLAAAQEPPAEKKSETKVPVAKTSSDADLVVKMEKLHIVDDSKAKPATKAERRAIQEAQRALKAKSLEEKKPAKPSVKKLSETPLKKSPDAKLPTSATPLKSVSNSVPSKVSALHKVKLFKHLYLDKCNLNINVNQKLHPAIIKLGLQYESDSIVGSNARCYAFINAMTTVSRTFVKL